MGGVGKGHMGAQRFAFWVLVWLGGGRIQNHVAHPLFCRSEFLESGAVLSAFGAPEERQAGRRRADLIGARMREGQGNKSFRSATQRPGWSVFEKAVSLALCVP